MHKSTKTISNHWKIDSMRLEIPKEFVDISHRFTDEYELWNKNTGVVEDLQEFQKKDMLEHDINGVKYYTRLYKRATKSDDGKFTGQTSTWLQVLLSSKMLESRYFEGITHRTIESLYNKIMSLEHFRCTLEVFKQAYVFDVDYCKDYQAKRSQFNDFVNDLSVKPNCSKVYKNTKGDVSTLQFNFREKATFLKPYYKIYNKYDEYRSRQRFEKLNAFYKAYNIPIPLETHFRKELTLKSKKSFKLISSQFTYTNTLNDALSLCDDNYGLKHVLDQLQGYKIRRIIQPKDYKSIPLLISLIVDLEKNNGLDNVMIKEKYLDHFKAQNYSKNTVTNLKKELAQQIDIYDMAKHDIAIEMSQEEYDEMNDLCFGL